MIFSIPSSVKAVPRREEMSSAAATGSRYLMKALSLVGVRLTAQQAAKVVPIAGQAVSAVLTYTALKTVCEMHIQQCLSVAQQLALPAPD